MEETTNPVAEVESDEDRMLEFLGGEEEQEDIPEVPQEPEEELEAPAEEELELAWNGEQIRKPKSEVLELAQKGFDYTQKTQALAEERKFLNEQAVKFQQQQQIQAQLSDKIAEIKSIEAQLNQFKGVDWSTLIDNDPVQAMKLDRQFRELQNFYQGKVGEVQQMAHLAERNNVERRQAMLQHEHQALLDAIPEWRDSDKMKSAKSEIRTYLAKQGFSDSEIGQASDHRQIVLARKAMLYDQLQSKSPAIAKKVQEAPKPVKASAPRTNQRNENYQRGRAELRKTGKSDVAAKLIESLL